MQQVIRMVNIAVGLSALRFKRSSSINAAWFLRMGFQTDLRSAQPMREIPKFRTSGGMI